jgi:hypothetical protein
VTLYGLKEPKDFCGLRIYQGFQTFLKSLANNCDVLLPGNVKATVPVRGQEDIKLAILGFTALL